MAGPLDGIRIVDLSNVLMGPFATQQLGDMGADVIKVEPASGDVIRFASSGRSEGMSSLFLNNNRNKRSLVLDLKQQEGRKVLLQLVAGADVLISNMRSDAMGRLGLRYEDTLEVNEKIIYVTCTGFGKHGPYAGRAAYDDIIQTMAGIPSLISRAYGDEPTFVPSNFCDRVTGHKVVSSVLAALLYRERSGKGQAVDVPMFETMVEFVMSDHLGGHTFEPPTDRTAYKRIVNPNRRPYRTKDGYLSLMVYTDKQWTDFLAIVGKPELMSDDMFASMQSRSAHIVEVYSFLKVTVAEKTTEEWLDLLRESDLAHAPVKELEDLFDDEHLNAVGFFREFDHPSEGRIRETVHPVSWSESTPEFQRHVPRLGEHNQEILHELGYSDEQIQALVEKKVTTAVP